MLGFSKLSIIRYRLVADILTRETPNANCGPKCSLGRLPQGLLVDSLSKTGLL